MTSWPCLACGLKRLAFLSDLEFLMFCVARDMFSLVTLHQQPLLKPTVNLNDPALPAFSPAALHRLTIALLIIPLHTIVSGGQT
jgi:hypothetical protein